MSEALSHDSSEPARPSRWKFLAGTVLFQSVAFRLDRSLSVPFAPEVDGRRLSREEIGRRGERLAALFLHKCEGMAIRYRNFRAPRGGEVDLVCRHGETLVFVEVKTRTSLAFGRPAEAVTRDKQHLITRGAMQWLRMLHYPPISFRFDIVEVLLQEGELPDITRIENAFGLPETIDYPLG